ncbi:hypothetical protein GLA29479_5057 [Lysobacter antibioticus]|uniref:Uncharacterized protein n=1 Tax=Lysobacter antibioticus TaxID=84531 RepID=A0A0S2FH97_LYSAN|nr:hypothetical protein GLA29479_5057 [Lysobacter antibioticus]ALN82922.1 hypothetical protein LA76x_4819 [Lysobacter antibioticus]
MHRHVHQDIPSPGPAASRSCCLWCERAPVRQAGGNAESL